jgi:hypothetical protein
MSIHWWPREELNENRETVERINQRMGYRLQLREISWPAEVALSTPFVVETSWANAGVAPCYGGGFWALTLQDNKGGLVSVNVNEGLDLKQLQPGPRDNATVIKSVADFTIGRMQKDSFGSFGPATAPGTYDVLISVGQRDGTPTIALPLPNCDGHRRYKLGQMRLTQS